MALTVGRAKEYLVGLDKTLADHDGLKKMVEESFARLDVDKSGHLDHAEARSLIVGICTVMSLPPPTDDDFAMHMKLLDQSGDAKLDLNEVGSGVVGALMHKAGSFKHFIGIAQTRGLDDNAPLPSA